MGEQLFPAHFLVRCVMVRFLPYAAGEWFRWWSYGAGEISGEVFSLLCCEWDRVGDVAFVGADCYFRAILISSGGFRVPEENHARRVRWTPGSRATDFFVVSP